MPINERFVYENHQGPATLYSEELITEICDAIASSEKGLQKLVDANPHWPSRTTIFAWLHRYPAFREKYAKAKQAQADVGIEYMQEMLDETHHYLDKMGNMRVDVNLLKAKVEHWRWHVGKLQPRKYGDSRHQELDNSELDDDIKKRHAAISNTEENFTQD